MSIRISPVLLAVAALAVGPLSSAEARPASVGTGSSTVASTGATPAADTQSADTPPAGTAAAGTSTSVGRPKLAIGRVTVVAPGAKRLGAKRAKGRAHLLVPVTYPLDMAGRPTTLRVNYRGGKGRRVKRVWKGRLSAGFPRAGDRRRSFRFVHEVAIGLGAARRMLNRRRGTGVRASADARIDIEGDGNYERDRGYTSIQSRVKRTRAGRCGSVELLGLAGGQRKTSLRLPRCGGRVEWTITSQPSLGKVSFAPESGVRVIYERTRNRLGSDQFEVTALRGGRDRRQVTRLVQIRSGRAEARSVSIRAMGDSVTAGFGYYGKTGEQMGIGELLGCKPGDTYYNDACSSNSTNSSNSSGSNPHYLADYGLSRNISWAAQWANAFGVTNYKNYAITGSAPTDWLEGGQFNPTFKQIQAQNPDFIVMTMGANPLLSDMLFGVDNMGCAIYSDLFGDYRSCIENAFAGVDLSGNLKKIYSELVDNTTSHIVLMQYHLSIPSSALAYSSAQIELMGELLNQVIADQAAAVSSDRITVVSPPRFNIGIDMKPLYPARFSCSFLGYRVDGPSVQSTPTQDELLADHPLSFCSGPPVGPPWVISGDTGIHPSAAGYAEMASQIPAP